MMVVHTYQVEKEITKFKYRNSTTPRGPTICIQNSSVLSLERVATATTTAIINPFGVLAEAKLVSTTRPWNKIQEHLRKVRTLTLGKTGDGKVATGNTLGRIVLAITNIAIGGKLCGPYPARITSHVNQQLTMALTTRQRIPVRANRKEKKNNCNLPNIHINDCTPSDHRNIVT